MRERVTGSPISSQSGTEREGNLPEGSLPAPIPPRAKAGAVAHVRRNEDGSWAEPQGLENHLEGTARLAEGLPRPSDRMRGAGPWGFVTTQGRALSRGNGIWEGRAGTTRKPTWRRSPVRWTTPRPGQARGGSPGQGRRTHPLILRGRASRGPARLDRSPERPRLPATGHHHGRHSRRV